MAEATAFMGRTRQRPQEVAFEPGFRARVDVLAVGAVWWRKDVERCFARRPPERRRREVRIKEAR